VPNLVINAGPGSGKTTTIIDIFSYLRATNESAWHKQHPRITEEQRAVLEWCKETLPEECRESCLYMAYNNTIKEELEKKIHPKAEARTSHGAGYSILNKKFGYLKINEKRSQHLVEKVTGQLLKDMVNKDRFQWLSTIRHLEKMKDELLDPTDENFLKVHEKYSDLLAFGLHSDMIFQTQQLMPLMKTPSRDIGIEYVDQVWLALFCLPKPIYKLGLVDECQDLSAARLALALRLCENLVFVGDPNQAINAFAGADSRAFDKIRQVCDQELPLKLSFRCPPNRCRSINAIKPGAAVRPLPEKEDGPETRETLEEYVELLKLVPEERRVEHLIICRYNAPLVKICLQLMRAKIPAYILGETLIKSLISMVKNRNAADIQELREKLKSYGNMLTRNCPEYVADIITDKINCIFAVLPQCTHVEDVETELKKMLIPKKHIPFITLSTIHRAKGLEAKHVAILFPPVEHPKASTQEQIEQEKNLHFVAESRTSHSLTWVVQG